MSIEARVATIISAREVALTAGEDKGVRVDDLVTLFRETSVKDPETQEDLGVVRRPAVRLRVTEVQARLSVARTYELVQRAEQQPRFNLTTIWTTTGDEPQPVRVTGDPRNVDFRTVYIPKGEQAEIDHPPPEEEEEEQVGELEDQQQEARSAE